MTVMTMTRPPAAAAQNNAAAACTARKNWKDGPRPRQESQSIKNLSILGNMLSGNRVIRNFKTSLSERQVTKLPNHSISQFPNFPISSGSSHQQMLQAFDRAHILSTLESAGVGTALLAHAALHLTHRFVLVPLHPIDHAALHVAQVIDAVAQQGRAQHGDIRSHHEEFDHVL